MHDTVMCAPVSGNTVVLWLKVELVKFVVVWQREQSCGNPSEAWFGLVAAL